MTVVPARKPGYTGPMHIKESLFRRISRPLWAILAACMILGGLLLWRSTATHSPAYRLDEVAAGKPILAVQGLPGTVHYPVIISRENAKAPRLEIVPAYFDFGRIDADQVVEHTFVIRNRGSADLLIRRAYTTCECTRAEISASAIPPGKIALATVRYDPRIHGQPGATLRRGVILESNDPDHTQSEIWVQARIK